MKNVENVKIKLQAKNYADIINIFYKITFLKKYICKKNNLSKILTPNEDLILTQNNPAAHNILSLILHL